jgi:hypothetical protein
VETTFSLGDGEGTLFWLDMWLSRITLRFELQDPFTIFSNPMLMFSGAVQVVIGTSLPNNLFGTEETIACNGLKSELPASTFDIYCIMAPFPLKCLTDNALFRGMSLTWMASMWKAPVPLKIKIFV